MSILAALVDSLVDIGASLTNLLVVRYSCNLPTIITRLVTVKLSPSRRWRKVCLSPVRHYSCFDGYSTSGISNTDDRSGRRGYRDNCGANLYDYPCLVSALGGAPDAKPAVRADMLHYQSDVMMNGAILLALGLSGTAGIAPMLCLHWGSASIFYIARYAWDMRRYSHYWIAHCLMRNGKKLLIS